MGKRGPGPTLPPPADHPDLVAANAWHAEFVKRQQAADRALTQRTDALIRLLATDYAVRAIARAVDMPGWVVTAVARKHAGEIIAWRNRQRDRQEVTR